MDMPFLIQLRRGVKYRHDNVVVFEGDLVETLQCSDLTEGYELAKARKDVLAARLGIDVSELHMRVVDGRK